MNPIFLDLGIIQIYWYSIFIFIGIVLGGTIILNEAKKYGISENFILNLFFWTIPIALIGARIYYVIFNWSLYSSDLFSILKVWEGGLAIHGGIIAGLIFVLLYSKKYKINPLLILDFIVVGLIIGQAIGRWGNFFNGEAHGGIVAYATLKKFLLPDFIIKGMYINGNYYIPTFLMESIWCFIGFIFMLLIRRNKYIKIGQVTSIYFIWYGIGRFFIEGFRTDSLMFFGFKAAQIVSLIMVIIGIIMLILLGKGSKFSNQYNDSSNTTDVKF